MAQQTLFQKVLDMNELITCAYYDQGQFYTSEHRGSFIVFPELNVLLLPCP